MDYLFYQVAAINGFDADGHYLRAGLILNACSQYAIAASPDCLATFDNSSSGSNARAASATTTPGYADTRRSPSLRKLDAYFAGKTLDLGGDTPSSGKRRRDGRHERRCRARRGAGARAPQPAPAAAPSQPQASGNDPASALLDYLLGGDG